MYGWGCWERKSNAAVSRTWRSNIIIFLRWSSRVSSKYNGIWGKKPGSRDWFQAHWDDEWYIQQEVFRATSSMYLLVYMLQKDMLPQHPIISAHPKGSWTVNWKSLVRLNKWNRKYNIIAVPMVRTGLNISLGHNGLRYHWR